jgi:hypothetical protein
MAYMTTEAKRGAEVLGYPHPGCFGKRGCKLLKTKDGGLAQRFRNLAEHPGVKAPASRTVRGFQLRTKNRTRKLVGRHRAKGEMTG